MKSLEVCERLTDVKKFDLIDMTSRLYNNLGVIRDYQGQFEKGVELLNKAITLCKANDVYESLHQAYNSLASILEKKAKYKDAIQNYNFAIEAAKKIKNKEPALCDCLVSKANILLKMGDIQAAKKSLHKAYKLKLSKKSEEEVTKKLKTVITLYRTEKELVSKSCTDAELQKCYEKMGDGFSDLSCFDRAIEYYLKMLEVAERTNSNLATCYYSLAATYRDDEQFDKAVEYFEKEYQLCDFKKGLDTLCEIADAKENGGCASSEIIQVYERAIQSCKRADNQREEGRMLGRLLAYLRRSKNLDQIPKYQEKFDETGFISSDSEESPPLNENSDDDVSLSNLTDDSEESESDSPNRKRRPKTFQVRRNLKGETQLHTACISGKLNVVSHLLEQGHPINIRDNGGWLPLHDACISGHYEIVKLLLDKGAAISDRGGTHCGGTTPLHDAAVNGHLRIMELLLDRGASALAKTDEGETPYHYLKKASIEMKFIGEDKHLCNKLLVRMSAILDTVGQSKEINTNIKNSAFISGQAEHTETNRRRLKVSESLMEAEVTPQERRNSLTRKISTSDSSEDDIYQSTEMSRSIHKSQATNEYKMVMNSLRKKPFDVPTTTEKEYVKRSAFVMNDEMVDDDWLEDDLGEMRSNKKRKVNYSDALIISSHTRDSTPRSSEKSLKRYSSLETISSRSSKSSRKSMIDSPTKRTPRKKSIENASPNKSDKKIHMEDIADLDLVDQFVPNRFIIDDDADDFILPIENQKNKQQSSLLDAGFVRCTMALDVPGRKGRLSQRRTLQPKITHFGNITPTKTTQDNFCRSSPSPKKRTNSSPVKRVLIDDDPILAVDVNIEGRPFRVTTRLSLKNTLTVKWLALEAARRYAKKEYVEPILELTTKSGAELVDDDLIGTLFITDTPVIEVNAKVLKWKLPHVRERYKEACLDMDTNPLDAICQKLDTMTISLSMKNNGFQSKSMAPLCKALLRENKLMELDLSNNFLSLDCIKLLASSLPTLENLTKLNLSCTNLHAEEMRILANMFSSSPINILTRLYSLDLSENFLRDESLQDIATITRYVNLKEVNLSMLNFTENVFAQSYNRNSIFNFNNLEELNLSGNNFENAALEKFLSFLDSSTLVNLDVSNNNTSQGFLTSLISCLGRDGARLNFDHLNLSRCSIDDSEVFNLLRSCDNLGILNLSYTEITSISLRRLLDSSIVKNIHLIGCENIDKYLDEFDTIWSSVDHFSTPKTLKITCKSEKFKTLISLWKQKCSDKICFQKKTTF
ncbi:hypothetical protein HHI36_018880 [Cryptolaemus montrouzieri]|uniref:Tonsoku-like protein n=1 Tax=Cryptolaemus montrouzieri TaxID=559131 RepID=A0ABD2P2D7_9CUCU